VGTLPQTTRVWGPNMHLLQQLTLVYPVVLMRMLSAGKNNSIRFIIIIMVLLGLMEKVNINQTSDFW
jgi:hypothetical protein